MTDEFVWHVNCEGGLSFVQTQIAINALKDTFLPRECIQLSYYEDNDIKLIKDDDDLDVGIQKHDKLHLTITATTMKVICNRTKKELGFAYKPIDRNPCVLRHQLRFLLCNMTDRKDLSEHLAENYLPCQIHHIMDKNGNLLYGNAMSKIDWSTLDIDEIYINYSITMTFMTIPEEDVVKLLSPHLR